MRRDRQTDKEGVGALRGKLPSTGFAVDNYVLIRRLWRSRSSLAFKEERHGAAQKYAANSR